MIKKFDIHLILKEFYLNNQPLVLIIMLKILFITKYLQFNCFLSYYISLILIITLNIKFYYLF
jgi:hypothetical protein